MASNGTKRSDLVSVVIGGDIGAYALGRELHEAFGLVSICVAQAPIGAIAHSKVFTVHNVESLSPENLEAALRDIAAAHADKRVFVVSNAEPIIATLARLEPSLPENMVMSVPPLEVVERLSDKVQFAELCQEHGLDVAQTEVVRFGPDAPEQIEPTKIAFPLVVKPAYSPEYAAFIARGFQKVYYLHEQAQLDELWAQLREAGFVGTMLVQELIEGDDTFMDSITMYVNGAGESCLLASAHVLLEDHAPTMLGNPVAMITQQVPDLWAHAAELLAAVGYRGFANFDVKRDPKTGRRIFFEVNTRIGRNSYYVCAGGVNPMRIAVEDLVDGVRHETQIASKKILYTLVPLSLLRRYVRDPELLAEVDDLIAKKLVFDPQRYAADRGVRRMMDVELTERNQIRKFAKYYPKPTDTSF